MGIGEHLAVLNLFREDDGTYEITVAGSPLKWKNIDTGGRAPIDVIEQWIVRAAKRMEARIERRQS